MILHAARAALPIAFVAAVASACGYYQASDKPICGDTVLPDGDACAVWPAPCGCPSDEKCAVSSSDGTFACAAPGPKGVDAPCADDSECAKGTLCDGTRCRQTCFEALDCGSDEAVSCLAWLDAKNKQIAGSCARDCDLVTPQAPSDPRLETCRADERCVSTGAATLCTRSSGKNVALGGACKVDVDCAAGAVCARGVCKAWCWVDDPHCPSGAGCRPFTDSQGQPMSVLGRAFGDCL